MPALLVHPSLSAREEGGIFQVTDWMPTILSGDRWYCPSLPPPCSYTTMDGMKKSYLFIAVAHGVVGMRTFACWCQACMQAIGRGQGSLDSNLHCAECVSPHLPWSERSCDRQDAAGRANARKKAQSYARQLASQLERRLKSAHVLVAVQNRGEDDPDQ